MEPLPRESQEREMYQQPSEPRPVPSPVVTPPTLTAMVAPEERPSYPIRRQISEDSLEVDFGNGDGIILFSTTPDPDPHYHYEWERLNTFQTWNYSFPSVRAMAATGFYYTNDGDKVRCFYCRGELIHWMPGDNPAREHRRWSPNCPMVLGTPCGNVSIGREPPEAVLFVPPTTPPETAFIPFRPPFATVASPRNYAPPRVREGKATYPVCPCYAVATRPSHPAFETPNARYLSFQTWPDNKLPTKFALLEAGFFFQGVGDKTMCYYCGGGLCAWKKDDDPWIEHAKYFSSCPFLTFSKGAAYIADIIPIDVEINTNEGPQTIRETTPAVTTPVLTQIPVEIDQTITNDEILDFTKLNDINLCKICYSTEVGAAIIPCGHQMSCYPCAVKCDLCAVCREKIHNIIRIYPS